MPGVIDYYFAPISGYAYLGHPKLMEIVAETGATLNVLPVDIGRVFGASETVPPFKQSEVRRTYRAEDIARWGGFLDLPVNPVPTHWPTPVGLACRVILASPSPADAAFALLKAVWADELDVAAPDDVAQALEAAGLDAAAHLAAADSAAARAEEVTEAAIAAGVFGSPTYVVNGVRYWGQDRLDFMAAALKEAA